MDPRVEPLFDWPTVAGQASLVDLFSIFLRELNLDLENPHLEDTPKRVVKMYRELFVEEPWEFTTFEPESQGIVIVRDIPIVSLCAHHWLPFTGIAHVAYVPNMKIAGLSKLARAVQHFCYGPQVQETIGERTVDFLMQQLEPIGAAVIIKASHSCMEIRGVKAHGSETLTSHLRGCFYKESSARGELMSLLRL